MGALKAVLRPAESDPFALCLRIHAILKGYWGRLAGVAIPRKSKALYLFFGATFCNGQRQKSYVYSRACRMVVFREQTARANKPFFVLRPGNEVLTF